MADWPADSLQGFLSDLWEKTTGIPALEKGRLMWGFLAHIDQKPRRLVLEGRGDDPNDHSKASYRVEAFDYSAYKVPDELPVAAMALPEGQEYFVFRAKMRPLLVLQPKGKEVPQELRRGGGTRSQTAPTILVAPYYGVEYDGTRAGWNPKLVERIRRGEYPQYMWDVLPIGRQPSILRLDHISPVGREKVAYRPTNYRLSTVGLGLLDEWLDWNFSGRLNPDGALYYLSQELLKLPPSESSEL